jgi:hypothetical protein
VPGPPKSLLKTLNVKKAGKLCECHHDKKNHKLVKGDTLLEVKVSRDISRLCIPCALDSVQTGIERLEVLRAELEQL